MYLDNVRSFTQGILLLVFAAIAYWGNPQIGLALVAFMGAMKVQECFTGWCPSDLVLRPMGLKKQAETLHT